MSRSTFPQQIDTFEELYDLPPSKVAQAKRYQELKMKPTLNATEQAELNRLTTELGSYIITPETWNKMGDAIVAVETFFKDNVDGYIKRKQEEWAEYVNSFHYVGAYNPSTHYKELNMVTYNGELYLCIQDAKGIAPTNVSYWQKISSKGDKGDVGLNINLRGNYSSTSTYVVGDAVIYNGHIYYCIKNTTAGIAPTDTQHWFLYDRTIVSNTAPTAPQQGLLWIEIEN